MYSLLEVSDWRWPFVGHLLYLMLVSSKIILSVWCTPLYVRLVWLVPVLVWFCNITFLINIYTIIIICTKPNTIASDLGHPQYVMFPSEHYMYLRFLQFWCSLSAIIQWKMFTVRLWSMLEAQLVCLCLLFGCVFAQQGEMLLNADFENPFTDDDWQGSGCNIEQSTDAYTGVYSCKVSDVWVL